MERLTFDGKFCDIAQCRETPGGSFCENGTCSQKEVWMRLKDYEDTGLTPESVEALKLSIMGKAISEIKEFNGLPIDRLRELAEADKDGRVVVLPCKVGDVVYGFHGRRTILPMVAKWIETNTDGWSVAAQYVPMAPKFYQFSNFGKTVFLTREEAEAALKEVQNGKSKLD